MFERARDAFERVDPALAGWMRTYGHDLLRWSLAVVFIWFGALKPFGLSEANDLVAATIYWAFDPDLFIQVLGWWEVLIGVCLLWRRLIRLGLFLLALQMGGTFLPLVLVPDVVWNQAPWWPTIEGQYVIKNLVIISGAIVVGGTVRPLESRRPPP